MSKRFGRVKYTLVGHFMKSFVNCMIWSKPFSLLLMKLRTKDPFSLFLKPHWCRKAKKYLQVISPLNHEKIFALSNNLSLKIIIFAKSNTFHLKKKKNEKVLISL